MQRPTDRKNPRATRKAAPRFDPRTSRRPSPSIDSDACLAGNDNPNVWDCGSPLYDSYEVVSFFYQLDKGLTTPPPAGTEQITSSNHDGQLEIPANPTFPPKSILENVNSKSESKKLKKHRFRRFFRWAFNISRMLVLRPSAKKCPRHRSLKADCDRKCAGDSVPQS